MASPNVVVDGSNIATEGRSTPSLAQLDEAVRGYLAEHPDAVVTVVVDATFGHRIAEAEREAFEEARAAGEIVSPPAGAIGRGDAFLLRIAEKTGATVLSNDSFQEFHGDHEWLFAQGRLVGGVPVGGVGWIWTPRTPVRGARSRESVKAAKKVRAKSPVAPSARTKKAPRPSAPPTARKRRTGVEQAIAVATVEVEGTAPKRRRRRRGAPPAEPVNEPIPFLTFVAEHEVGGELEGEVESFSSHGAFVRADGVRCYVPLSALGDPPPRSAREVLTRGERRKFVLQALDPPRRGVELALPAFVHVSGSPTEETVAAEIKETAAAPAGAAGKKRTAPAKKKAARAPTKAATKKAAPKKSAPAKKPAVAKKKSAPAKKTAVAKKKSAPAKKPAVAKTKPAKTKPAKTKAPPARKSPAARKLPAKPAKAAKRAPAKKAASVKKSGRRR